MPELPEVETVVRGLRPALEGRYLRRVEQRVHALRFPFPEGLAARLTGRRVTRLSRRAKYILCELDGGEVLLLHLGMSGRLLLGKPGERPYARHDHLILESDRGCELRFNDARRFGIVELFPIEELECHPLLAGLGPEPLGNAFNGPELARRLKGRRTPITAALLDQKTVAGIGNIYASEALYQAGISPRRKALTVQGGRAERLAAAIRDVLERAIAAGGSSLRDYLQADGELGYFQHSWAVYDREGEACPDCTCDINVTGGIQRLVQSNRATFFCPRRQR
jgi:formamidopyrimidine-DNA glycosylase